MLNRIWTLSFREKTAEKLRKKTGGAFFDFPRFGSAHCKYGLKDMKGIKKKQVTLILYSFSPSEC